MNNMEYKCPEHNKPVKLNDWGKYFHFNGKDSSGKSLWCNKTKEDIEGVDPKWIGQGPTTGEANKDPEAEGKVRHGVVVAVIQHGGLEALKGQLNKIDKVVSYIMSGEINEE